MFDDLVTGATFREPRKITILLRFIIKREPWRLIKKRGENTSDPLIKVTRGSTARQDGFCFVGGETGSCAFKNRIFFNRFAHLLGQASLRIH